MTLIQSQPVDFLLSSFKREMREREREREREERREREREREERERDERKGERERERSYPKIHTLCFVIIEFFRLVDHSRCDKVTASQEIEKRN